ncbi:MAG TPA: hypothetical protein VN637_02190 [Roseiarcus sp.]|jgi:hypothetical protein|nr:hypothetical protein [Roseiarcus sp.]
MRGHWAVRRLASFGIAGLALGLPAEAGAAQRAIASVHGIATGIAACWRPAHNRDQVTVRVSFTREGAVIGEPRIVFVKSAGGRADDAALGRSMLTAIRHCAPLNFSAQLGSAIAGQVLDIHFIGPKRATVVAPP